MCTFQPRLRATPSVSTSMRTKVEQLAGQVKPSWRRNGIRITDKVSWHQPALRDSLARKPRIMSGAAVNQLFYDDNLDVLCASIKDESVDSNANLQRSFQVAYPTCKFKTTPHHDGRIMPSY
jgi:hypothetical protein